MIIFPTSIANNAKDRPVVMFKSKKTDARNADYIVLPIPQSLQFSDSAAYNNSELGFGGAAILNAGKSESISDAFSNVMTQGRNSVPQNMRSLVGLLGSKTLGGENRAAVGVATGTTLNKNIVTEFTGISTRQFSFQFKLIAVSNEESVIIRNMIDVFREGLYPEGNSLQLQYPPTWYINFKKNGADIEHIPKIFESYLTNLQTSYNDGMNMFHEDGSPVEVDIQLTFIESRALTLADIQSLKERPFKEGDFKRAFLLTESITKAASDADKLAAANEDARKAKAARQNDPSVF
jgi:hypothetical protein